MKHPSQLGSAAPERWITVCIDDVGMNAGTVEAALALVSKDRVHALGGMVGGSAWTQASSLLRQLDPVQVDLGLHLDLTQFPLLPGSRHGLGTLIGRAYLGFLSPDRVGLEIRAQLDAFEQVIGRAPAYVDGHQHVHQLPVVRDVLMAELKRRYADSLPWLRSTRAGNACAGDPFFSKVRLKPRVIQALGAHGMAHHGRGIQFGHNRRLLGVYDFNATPERYGQLLASWLDAAISGDLLMIHASAFPEPADPRADARQIEYRLLASDAFGALLQREAINLAPMSRILPMLNGRTGFAAAGEQT